MMYNGYYSPYNGAMNDVLSQYKGQYQQPMMPMQPQQMQMMRNQQPSTTPQPAANDVIWVQGESGAKAYLVAPNSTVTLWDSENPVIYVKSADPNGVPSMRILDFVERNAPPANNAQNARFLKNDFDPKDYVRLEKFDDLMAKYAELEGVIKKISKKKEAE